MTIEPEHHDYEELFAKTFGVGGSFTPHRRPRQKDQRQENQPEAAEQTPERKLADEEMTNNRR